MREADELGVVEARLGLGQAIVGGLVARCVGVVAALAAGEADSARPATAVTSGHA